MSTSKQPPQQREVETAPTTKFILGEYSFETLARTAVHLLEGDDYVKAAERALRLLEACRVEFELNQAICLLKEYDGKEIADFVKDHKIRGYFAPYSIAIKIITDQRRLDRAKKHFMALLEFRLKRRFKDDYTPEILTQELTIHEKGMYMQKILEYRTEYQRARQAGELGMKAAPKKNKGTAKEIS